MVYQITLCCLLVLGFGWLLWRLSGLLRTPVQRGEHTQLTVAVTAQDTAPELENLLRGLIWLHDSGTLRAELLVIDAGLTPEARMLAQKLSQQRGFITIYEYEDFCQWMQTRIK